MAYYNPPTDFNPSPFSAQYKFIPIEPIEPIPQPVHGQYYDDDLPDPVIEEKQRIIEKRQNCYKKDGKKKKKQPRLPGQKLLMRLYQNQQLENSICRVVKEIGKYN